MEPDLSTVLNRYINELAAANHKLFLAEARAAAAEEKLSDREGEQK